MLNSILFSRKNQDWQCNLPEDTLLVSPERAIESLYPSQKIILNLLIKLGLKHNTLYISQDKLALYAGVTREWANKTIRELVRRGLVYKKYRHMQTSLYRISEVLLTPHMRSRLGHILTALRTLSLALLLCSPLHSSRFSSHKFNIKNNIFILSSSSESLIGAQVNGARGINTTNRKEIDFTNPIPDYIRDLKELNLSKWGQIRLCMFTKETIDYASDKLRSMPTTHVKNLFGWFFQLCMQYSFDNGIMPDWEWYRQLSYAFKMPENARYTLEVEKKKPFVKRVSYPKYGVNSSNKQSEEKPVQRTPFECRSSRTECEQLGKHHVKDCPPERIVDRAVEAAKWEERKKELVGKVPDWLLEINPFKQQ